MSEHRCIEVVKAFLREKFGFYPEDERKPDAESSETKEVDCLLISKNQSFAIEHTLIQQFDRQLESERQFQPFIQKEFNNRGFLEKLKAVLGTGRTLSLYYPASTRLRKSDLDNLISFLKDWVIDWVSGLTDDGKYHARAKDIESGRSHLWVKCSVEKISEENSAVFAIVPVYAGNEGQDFREIIRKAFETKVGKLRPYRKKGCKTILILERVHAFPSPYIPSIYAAELMSKHYVDDLDIVICLSFEEDENLCELQYAEKNGISGRDIFKHNWWQYDLDRKVIWQRPWE